MQTPDFINLYAVLGKLADIRIKKQTQQMKSKKMLFAVLLLVAIIGGFMYNKYRVAPTFLMQETSYTDLDGNPVSLQELKAKGILLNYWATWCPPCRAEMPDFEAVYPEFKSKGIEIIAVSDDPIETLKAFQTQHKYSFKIWHSTKPLQDYKVFSIPTTFLLNEKLQNVDATVGAPEWNTEDTKQEVYKKLGIE